MDTAFPTRSGQTHAHRWSLPVYAGAAGAVLLLAGAAFTVAGQHTQVPVTTSTGGLSPQQIVIRGEVADRLATSAGSGLSPQQIVIRGEVADRLATSAGSGR